MSAPKGFGQSQYVERAASEDSGVHRRDSSRSVGFTLLSAGASDIGRRRKNNEDRFAVVDTIGLYLVADGMGGHAAGEVASSIAATTIVDFVSRTRTLSAAPDWPFPPVGEQSHDEDRLQVALRLANRLILDEGARERGHRGLGTTGVALLAGPSCFSVANVGDSRAYRFRSGTLELLTCDHTLYNDIRRTHSKSPICAELCEQKNVLTRALGASNEVSVDTQRVQACAGDVFLLCSDGLHAVLADEEISLVLLGGGSPAELVTALIARANARGGPDNVTVIVIQVRV